MTLLKVTGLQAHFVSRTGSVVRAVDDVSFHISADETVGLVGESGCGKSTLARNVMRLSLPSSGRIEFDGVDISRLGERAMRPFRRRMQMVFQDPFGSLNPRHTIRSILTTPLRVHGVGDRDEQNERVNAMMDKVGLPRRALGLYPHEFSGGQRQRIGIARALIFSPEIIVCDEPVSALDLSIQAQILNLLAEMKREFGLSYLFISHDLSVVSYFTDRVLVMYLGRIVESAEVRKLWKRPRHPYTQALMAAAPHLSQKPSTLELHEDTPDPTEMRGGCRFHPRCPRASTVCRQIEPALEEVAGDGHLAACHYPD
jgi:peptide/nickel transport system ATP-binding protein